MEKCRPNNTDYYGDNYGKQQLVVADVMTALLVVTHCVSDVRYNRLDGHHDENCAAFEVVRYSSLCNAYVSSTFMVHGMKGKMKIQEGHS